MKCSLCSAGHYKEGRVCLQCYDAKSAKSRYMSYIMLSATLAFLLTLTIFMVKRAARKRGATSDSEVGKKALDFTVWAVILLQTMTQVATAGSDLPAVVKSITDLLKIVQIDLAYGKQRRAQ